MVCVSAEWCRRNETNGLDSETTGKTRTGPHTTFGGLSQTLIEAKAEGILELSPRMRTGELEIPTSCSGCLYWRTISTSSGNKRTEKRRKTMEAHPSASLANHHRAVSGNPASKIGQLIEKATEAASSCPVIAAKRNGRFKMVAGQYQSQQQKSRKKVIYGRRIKKMRRQGRVDFTQRRQGRIRPAKRGACLGTIRRQGKKLTFTDHSLDFTIKIQAQRLY